MKKFTMITVFMLALGVLTPAMPEAHAASVLDQILAQAISQNPTASQVQDLVRIKQDLEQGNKGDILGMLAQTAATRLGGNELASVAATAAAGGDVSNALQNALTGQVQQRVGDRLGIPPEGMAVIASLLQDALTPKAVQDNNNLEGAPQNYRAVLDMTATAYAPGRQDNGRWNNLTYLGGPIKKGVVAVDPRIIPLGTKLWVEGYGPAVAADEGSAILGHRIDLAFNTRQEALDYGMKSVKVYVLQ